jgi:predicted ATP-grasp superfamily ATP-dependent carboligase
MTDTTTPLVLQTAPRTPSLRTALPTLAAYESVTDKLQLFDLARKAGVRVPQTLAVSRKNADSLRRDDFHYPVVVKPRVSSMRGASGIVKRAVRYARDARELASMLREELLEETDEVLLQEYVGGYGSGVFCVYDAGQPLFFFAHRRVREKPPSGGVSVVCESVPLPDEGVMAARRILDPLRWHGVAMVEFKIDAQGRSWLIEINARFWGSLQLAVDCGADFPWFVHQLATGHQPAKPQPYTVGTRLRWWLGDLDNLYARLRSAEWTPSLWHKIKAVGEFALPWQPGLKYEFLRWRDPWPAATALHQYLRAL